MFNKHTQTDVGSVYNKAVYDYMQGNFSFT